MATNRFVVGAGPARALGTLKDIETIFSELKLQYSVCPKVYDSRAIPALINPKGEINHLINPTFWGLSV